jgi:hypothetical protein
MLLIPTAVALSTPAQADSERAVQFIGDENFPPSQVYWLRQGGTTEYASRRGRHAFLLPLPTQSSHTIVLVYRLGVSDYLPASWEVQVKVFVGPESNALPIALPMRRWESCTPRAFKDISGYPVDTPTGVVRAILEARFLLAYRDDASCAEWTGRITGILNDRRRQLRSVAQYISFP